MGKASLAGTRRGYDLCAGCRHARSRHHHFGGDHCNGTTRTPPEAEAPEVIGYTTRPCTCTTFTERTN